MRRRLRSEGGKKAVEGFTNNEIRIKSEGLRNIIFGSVLYEHGAIFGSTFSINQASEPTIRHQMVLLFHSCML